MSTKFNYEEPVSPSTTELIYEANQAANTFTPSQDYDLDFVVMNGWRSGACGDVTMHIYKADGAHKPTEASLGNVVKAQATIPEAPAEITFTFGAAVSLTSGQEYIVIFSAVAFTFVWYSKYIFPATQGGWYTESSNGGSSWSAATQYQQPWFQVWGTAAGNDPVDTPSPTDSATGQQSGSVDLSWADPNDPDFDDYEVYFGPTGSMVLVETGYGSLSLTILDDLILGQEYSWRIDGNDGVNVVTGSVWTFTIESFDPPTITNLRNKRYLIVVSNDEVWYEDL